MKKKKHALTLLEIMVVICLITTIIGVIGYNMKGALDKGKVFRTERAMEQLRDLLLYQLAQPNSKHDAQSILADLRGTIRETGLTKDPDNLLNDGWGVPFEIKADRSRTDFIIHSKKLEQYYRDHKIGHAEKSSEQDEEDL